MGCGLTVGAEQEMGRGAAGVGGGTLAGSIDEEQDGSLHSSGLCVGGGDVE